MVKTAQKFKLWNVKVECGSGELFGVSSPPNTWADLPNVLKRYGTGAIVLKYLSWEHKAEVLAVKEANDPILAALVTLKERRRLHQILRDRKTLQPLVEIKDGGFSRAEQDERDELSLRLMAYLGTPPEIDPPKWEVPQTVPSSDISVVPWPPSKPPKIRDTRLGAPPILLKTYHRDNLLVGTVKYCIGLSANNYVQHCETPGCEYFGSCAPHKCVEEIDKGEGSIYAELIAPDMRMPGKRKETSEKEVVVAAIPYKAAA